MHNRGGVPSCRSVAAAEGGGRLSPRALETCAGAFSGFVIWEKMFSHFPTSTPPPAFTS